MATSRSRLSEGPYFAESKFSLVDAAFAPVFRYFDVFDTIADFGILEGKPKTTKWRQALRERPSVKSQSPPTTPRVCVRSSLARKSWLSQLMQMAA